MSRGDFRGYGYALFVNLSVGLKEFVFLFIRKNVTKFWCGIVILSFSGGVQASCNWNPKDPFRQVRTFKYSGPGVLNVPVDASGGEVYKEVFSSYYPSVMVLCIPIEKSGFRLSAALGSQPASGDLFPIRGTGLSLKVRLQNYFSFQTIVNPGENWNITGADTTFDFSNRYEISFVITGEVNEGATIPAGLLGAWVTKSGFEVARFELVSPINIASASCTTPSVNVQMGDDYRLAEFDTPGVIPRNVDFNISLNSCSKGIRSVEYLLKANTDEVDVNSGVVSLSKASTAEGVNLQVKSADGVPLVLGVYHKFSDYNSQGGNLKIPLSASYLRAANEKLKAGTANAEITFIMKYL